MISTMDVKEYAHGMYVLSNGKVIGRISIGRDSVNNPCMILCSEIINNGIPLRAETFGYSKLFCLQRLGVYAMSDYNSSFNVVNELYRMQRLSLLILKHLAIRHFIMTKISLMIMSFALRIDAPIELKFAYELTLDNL